MIGRQLVIGAGQFTVVDRIQVHFVVDVSLQQAGHLVGVTFKD